MTSGEQLLSLYSLYVSCSGRWTLTNKFLLLHFCVIAAVLIMCIMKIAKASLDKALAENADIEGILGSEEASTLPVKGRPTLDIQQPLVIKIDPSRQDFVQ